MLTFGELFAGIGGFSLGLERAGMKCKWQVEIEPYARAVLKKHWPEVPKHDDVRTFPPQGDYSVDLICGGFPCQDISVAGKGAGLEGERSGLWHDFARIICAVQPTWVVIENVPALTYRGLGHVLGDLAEIGFDAEWHCIPASAVGAPHRRERVWIVAHSNRQRREEVSEQQFVSRWEPSPETIFSQQAGGQKVAHANCSRRKQQRRPQPIPAEQFAAECGGWWESEPDVGRVAHGVPSRVDRLRCLGNAVVPQVVEVIGRAIVEHEKNRTASGMRL
jgi:DNA (cytosine-5)-methyltransferase 1